MINESEVIRARNAALKYMKGQMRWSEIIAISGFLIGIGFILLMSLFLIPNIH